MSDIGKKSDPQGIIAIMTSPDGHVIATCADFNRDGYGGFELWEAQILRASDQVKWAAIRAYCSYVVVKSLSSYITTQIADALCHHGHKIVF